MRLYTILNILVLGAFATATSVSYDPGYDNAMRSMSVVACSDGANGLITRYGWNVQGDYGGFPYIGGSGTVTGWNSPNCGKCYTLTYRGKTIHVLAVDHAGTGFNIAMAAMNDLTNGHAYELGRIEAQSAEVPVSECGL
ncbi:hypothetical protein W97_05112 [Coniosporium apollinis CBS 100218]|uniref:Uncharacterized protein n=1 Tax=Coniosporium apollinis (strain CBS 100218) TaxID=1168221 RepID=R7YVA8_CONA1|nr:uncharacterized protein W97_05112 [Coniosporium apollinis CBS 100218]EON65870.1 hypothetical protein W97_05112 [Coniosporium apollinis CBS 100218]